MSNSRLLKPETHRYYLIDDNENEANESDISNQQEDSINIPPKDHYQIVYLIFFLQGVAMLLGWNVFITASVFFHSRFLGSPYSDNFQNYFSIVNMGSNLLFLTHALYTQTTANVSVRLIFSLFVSAFTFFAITVSTQFLELFTPSGYFYFAITLVFLIGMTTAYQQNAIFGIVALFPPKYTQAVMSGQGLAGLAISLSQIFSALAVDQTSNQTPAGDDLTLSTFIYFLSAFAVILVSLVSYFILIRLPLYIYHVSPDLTFVNQGVDNSLNERSYKNTFNKINKLIFAVAFVFCVTLSVYPSITSFIKFAGQISTISRRAGDNQSESNSIYVDLSCYFLAINTAMQSVSNGYVGSLAMMAGPQVVGVEKDLAGILLSYFLVVGLTVGSIFSFPLRAISWA
ncbi:13763_t:CDS:2 [Dentiscutata heterogama]|uniref:13763_t:CDS:1 n=1 Tax=Dentiscutata heterogama TaxID=1316150 RepID=A0ACA9M4X0_9GLOM|nr:13763_t:CDS:2 [Dentiscutata heterogama]